VTRIPLGVLDTGSANLASVLAAFDRLDASPRLICDADAVRTAERLVLPGVGAFGAVMSRLSALGTVDALRERFAAGRPVLAICLGLQVLAEASVESPGVAGLGIVSGSVNSLPTTVRIPQLGWNDVIAGNRGSLVRDGQAYFANSFCLTDADSSWTVHYAEHGIRFIAAMERGPQLACQFHPELSGRWGSELLNRWWTQC
jgi:imidazole glycerol phosphate synthase glutamine amidotransferase subunit